MNTFEILTQKERSTVETSTYTGFLEDFIEWAGAKTDAPEYTLKAAGLMALSLAAGDTLVMPNFFGPPIYMNLYLLVVGPSTVLRKSTVLGMVKDILPRNMATGEDYIVTVDDVSVQAFNKVAAKQGELQAPVLLNVDEVAGLFQTIRRSNSYLAGFDKTLMKAYDHSPIHISRVDSSVVAPEGAFVNVFAASTPEPLMDVLNSDDVASGLLPRFIIFDARGSQRGQRKTLMERLNNNEEWGEGADNLRQFLLDIAVDRASGAPTALLPSGKVGFPVTVMGISNEAVVWLDRLDATWTDDAGRDSSNWAAIKGRGYWHLMKLAGLFALSRAGRGAQVELIDVLRAAHLVEATIGDLATMQEDVGSTVSERRLLEVKRHIEQKGGGQMKTSRIARDLKVSFREMSDIAQTLGMREEIKILQTEDGMIWKVIA